MCVVNWGPMQKKDYFRYFIILILLKIILFSFSFSRADFLLNETSLQSENAEQAIWKISDRDQLASGTGFFIGENHFITNFHVISGMLNRLSFEGMSQDQNIIDHIFLSQEGSSSILRVKGVLAISALYDLALLETEENVTNFLSLREDPPQPGESLFSMAYVDGIFTEIRKIGEIFYEDNYRYDFPADILGLRGASGGPVLDEQGQVTGVTFNSAINLQGVIKTNYLRELIKGNIGTECSKFGAGAGFVNTKMCIEKEIQRLREAAEKESAFAQYRLARLYYYGEEFPRDVNKAFQWFEKAAKQGYVLAQANLVRMYRHGEGTQKDVNKALQWMKRVAEQGLPLIQYHLALMYYYGEGTQKDVNKAFQWMREAAEQGYAFAVIFLPRITKDLKASGE